MSTENKIELLFEHLIGGATGMELERETFTHDLTSQPLLYDVLRLVRALPYALETHPVPAELKARILAAIKEEQAVQQHMLAPKALAHSPPHATAPLHAHPAASLHIQRAEEGEWIDLGLKGVTFKHLFVDHETGYATTLVRMAPDSWYPTHRHAGYEECYMLQGEVSCGEVQLFAGDYQRMTGGTLHQPLHTKTGCMFLVVASEHNEVVLT